jgi:hypothetical protein
MGEYFTVGLVGSLGYSGLEIMWRGHTHWTMSLTGGACLLLLYVLDGRMDGWNLIARCLVGCGVITGIEFAVGCVVNLLLGWNVWNYSNQTSSCGQVCRPSRRCGFFVYAGDGGRLGAAQIGRRANGYAAPPPGGMVKRAPFS